jgi:hypothetical protein
MWLWTVCLTYMQDSDLFASAFVCVIACAHNPFDVQTALRFVYVWCARKLCVCVFDGMCVRAWCTR